MLRHGLIDGAGALTAAENEQCWRQARARWDLEELRTHGDTRDAAVAEMLLASSNATAAAETKGAICRWQTRHNIGFKGDGGNATQRSGQHRGTGRVSADANHHVGTNLRTMRRELSTASGRPNIVLTRVARLTWFNGPTWINSAEIRRPEPAGSQSPTCPDKQHSLRARLQFGARWPTPG